MLGMYESAGVGFPSANKSHDFYMFTYSNLVYVCEYEVNCDDKSNFQAHCNHNELIKCFKVCCFIRFIKVTKNLLHTLLTNGALQWSLFRMDQLVPPQPVLVEETFVAGFADMRAHSCFFKLVFFFVSIQP